jgi:hypothetical protein
VPKLREESMKHEFKNLIDINTGKQLLEISERAKLFVNVLKY